MREVTRNLLIAIGVATAVLLALGALPSYLQSGDPYYLTAAPVDSEPASVDGANLSARQYPYATEALDAASGNSSGRSEAYYRGPFGLKEAFTHSPFDEMDALRQQYPETVEGDAAYVARNGTVYELTVVQETDG